MDNKGIYFTELTLENVRCFGEKATLKLSDDNGKWCRWNVILGDNGTGKTTLLQCLAGFEFQQKTFVNGVQYIPILADRIKAHSLNNKGNVYNVVATITNQQIPTHIGLSGFASSSGHTMSKTPIDLFILGYGANRRISFEKLSEGDAESSETLYNDDAKLINTEEWLYQMEFAASRESEIKVQAEKRRDLIMECLKNILPDVDDIRFREPVSIDSPLPKLEFKTPFGWQGIHQLSFGYKTMVGWIVDVAARMFKRYPLSDNPLSEPVVILVDEIDLHLHPKWQRQIFDFLEARFPNAQFVVTAHSPLIVQSAPADANIIVLKKETAGDENIVVIDDDVASVRHWRLDQIMTSDIFGLESARSPEVEKNLKERTQLLQLDNLDDAQQARLTVLNDIAYSLPTADNQADIKAMEIIRKAAEYLNNNGK